jgi:hypothetical protein
VGDTDSLELERSAENSPSYVRGLKRRIEQLEALQQAKRLCQSPPLSEHHDGERASQAQPGGLSAAEAIKDLDSRGDGAVLRDALAEFGQLALSTMAADTESKGQRGFSMSQIVSRAMTVDVCSMPGQEDATLKSILLALPFSRSVMEPYLQLYTKTVLKLHSFMRKERLEQDFENVLVIHERAADLPLPAGAYPVVFLVYITIATAACRCLASQSSLLLGLQLHSQAVRLLPMILAQGESMSAMRCLVSAALHGLYGPDFSTASQLLSLAIGRAMSLGLHRLASPSTKSANTRDLREARELFWVLYLLDW